MMGYLIGWPSLLMERFGFLSLYNEQLFLHDALVS